LFLYICLFQKTYREDWEADKSLIYFPAHITPGYEAAVEATKATSDVSTAGAITHQSLFVLLLKVKSIYLKMKFGLRYRRLFIIIRLLVLSNCMFVNVRFLVRRASSEQCALFMKRNILVFPAKISSLYIDFSYQED